jgi:hypothetical protein
MGTVKKSATASKKSAEGRLLSGPNSLETRCMVLEEDFENIMSPTLPRGKPGHNM